MLMSVSDPLGDGNGPVPSFPASSTDEDRNLGKARAKILMSKYLRSSPNGIVPARFENDGMTITATSEIESLR